MATIQSSVNAQRTLSAILFLAHGAGTSTPELVNITPTDIENIAGDCFIVHIPDRDVPVLNTYTETLNWLLSIVPENESLLSVSHSKKDNLGSLWKARVQLPSQCPSVVVRKLRHTWMSELLRTGMPVTGVLQLAGLESLSTVERLLVHLPEYSLYELQGFVSKVQ